MILRQSTIQTIQVQKQMLIPTVLLKQAISEQIIENQDNQKDQNPAPTTQQYPPTTQTQNKQFSAQLLEKISSPQNKQIDSNKKKQGKKIQETILYEKQFSQLYEEIHQWMRSSIMEDMYLNECDLKKKTKALMIVGERQCGKKYLFSQVLEKIQDQFKTDQISDRCLSTKIISFQTLFINREILYSHPHLFKQRIQHCQDSEQQMNNNPVIGQPLQPTSQKISIYVRIISNLSPGQFSPLSHPSFFQHQQLSFYLNVYCCGKEISNVLSGSIMQKNIELFTVCLPDFIFYDQKSQVQKTQTTHGQLMSSFKKLILGIFRQIQLSLNKWLAQIDIKCTITCTEKVVCFLINYMSKRYQQSKNRIQNPLLALKYLANHLKNRWWKQLKSYKTSNSPSNQTISITCQQSTQNIISLNLSSFTISQFFSQKMSSSPNQSFTNPSISQIPLSSFIMGHQILFIACYHYLSHPAYLDSLYINALELFRFFIAIQEGLKIQSLGEDNYWRYLQKFKEMGLVKFKEDVKREIKQKSHRSQVKEKLILVRNYRNKEFVLRVSKQRIKDQLQEVQIFSKFFGNQQ